MNLISHRKKGRKKKGMKKSTLNMQIGRGKMKTNDLLTMLRHLSMTIHAGVPLLKALSILEEDAKGAKKRLLGHLKRSVEAGHKLADAMENAPMKFPDLVVTMVRTGEIGGTLEMSINRVMHRIKRSKELKGKVIGAMMYPVMILSMVTALGLAMGLFVLPQITPLFKSMGAELPLPTRIMMLGSEILQEYYLHMGIGFIVFLIVFILVSKIEIIKYMEHSFLLKIPLLKTVIKFVAIVNLLGTFGSLMQSGVPLKEALENGYGIFSGKVVTWARLRFSSERARWVSKEQWHPQQKGKFEEDGSYLLEVPFSDNRELIMDILRHGSEVEIISPQKLRKRVAQELKSALKYY